MSQKKAHGQIRQSQIITTFGPGALVDLPNYSVIVGGLDDWFKAKNEADFREIFEARLLDKLRTTLEIFDLKMYEPPVDKNDPTNPSGSVRVWRFPEWFVTEDIERGKEKKKRVRYLVHLNSLEKGVFITDERKPLKVVPVRFVRACESGHIGDIDWPDFVHALVPDNKVEADGQTVSNNVCQRQLYIEEKGTSGDLSEVFIKCDCGAKRNMQEAYGRDDAALGHCDGNRPWLGSYNKERCGIPNRLLIRNASNAYFPQVMSVISIPEPEDKLSNLVTKHFNTLKNAETVDTIDIYLTIEALKNDFEGFQSQHIFDEMMSQKNGGSKGSHKPVKDAEIETLLSAANELGDDKPMGDFYAKNMPKTKWDAPWMGKVDRVVLCHRLREVTAQLGFTRFEAASPNINGEPDDLEALRVKRAPLARDWKWVPAVENRGEGVFISFSNDEIGKWLENPHVVRRGEQLLEAFNIWKKEKHSKAEFVGLPYIMLHSLSHLLITSVSLDCGYPASSIRERVYSSTQGCGILLYTGTPDSEGTMGGLVEVGRNIKKHMKSALELGILCSNDPVCAQHDPRNMHERRFLSGCACHGCLLIAETSCEMQNNFLDRALVVPTLQNHGSEFFTKEMFQ